MPAAGSAAGDRLPGGVDASSTDSFQMTATASSEVGVCMVGGNVPVHQSPAPTPTLRRHTAAGPRRSDASSMFLKTRGTCN